MARQARALRRRSNSPGATKIWLSSVQVPLWVRGPDDPFGARRSVARLLHELL